MTVFKNINELLESVNHFYLDQSIIFTMTKLSFLTWLIAIKRHGIYGHSLKVQAGIFDRRSTDVRSIIGRYLKVLTDAKKRPVRY